MRRIKVLFENCFWIKKLNCEFDFSSCRAQIIYASNWTMKSSFANTFKCISEGISPRDRIFDNRTSRYLIDEDGAGIDPNKIFVIPPMIDKYNSRNVSVLLANRVLREEYEDIIWNIQRKKNSLLSALRELTGVSAPQTEKLYMDIFSTERENLYEILKVLFNTSLLCDKDIYWSIKYSILFNNAVEKFINDNTIHIENYIETYRNLLSWSSLFSQWLFDHNNLEHSVKELTKNKFFSVWHKIKLRDWRELVSEEEVLELLEQEKNRIFQDDTLKQRFNEIDKLMDKNQELRLFRSLITKNPFVILELSNLDALKTKLLLSYLKLEDTLTEEVVSSYEGSMEWLNRIRQTALQEQALWKDVIDVYHSRFSVPFKLIVSNQEDVILKGELPSIIFEYKDGNDVKKIWENQLMECLSQGEKRALYLLNIIFDIKTREASNIETLFIIDDIADSFDYKNKYAIIEYLNDILNQNNNFFMIILTHNFDFYRTTKSRIWVIRKNSFDVSKDMMEVKLKEQIYQKNPFEHRKTNLDDNSKLIALIPFLRNICEYTNRDNEFNLLTEFLHIKSSTKSKTLADIQQLVNYIINGNNWVSQYPHNLYFDTLKNEATSIIRNNDLRLESKIVLSIVIRLLAEDYMITQINDSIFVSSITKDQTLELINEYKRKFPRSTNLKIIEKVRLMTPEGIHLNAFMYEPILDIADEHLKSLYRETLNL